VQNTITGYADFLLDFAIARAFDRPEPARDDWTIAWPDHPRTLAPALPIAPTGSSYVRVDHVGAPRGSRLRIEATWEEHATFRWGVVKFDHSGMEIGRLAIPAQDKVASANITLDDLDAVDSILIVAVNVGDPAVPFDPDASAWEPHKYLLSLAQQQ
jgi:hypothetical protein